MSRCRSEGRRRQQSGHFWRHRACQFAPSHAHLGVEAGIGIERLCARHRFDPGYVLFCAASVAARALLQPEPVKNSSWSVSRAKASQPSRGEIPSHAVSVIGEGVVGHVAPSGTGRSDREDVDLPAGGRSGLCAGGCRNDGGLHDRVELQQGFVTRNVFLHLASSQIGEDWYFGT